MFFKPRHKFVCLHSSMALAIASNKKMVLGEKIETKNSEVWCADSYLTLAIQILLRFGVILGGV